MLTELAVENFALVERLRLTFGPGLNLLTGETGAGKSILLDALGMVLGERTSVEMVRFGATRARVEALFSLDGADGRLFEALHAAGVEPEEGALILTRELTTAGKSAARINGRPVTVATLKTVGDALVDIHGQHEHQSLLRTERHVDLLDSWADALPCRQSVAEAHAVLKAVQAERDGLVRDARERARTLDLLAFQRDEIDAAALAPDEEEALELERARLAGAERLHAAAASAYDSLRNGALDALGRAVSEIERGSRVDPQLASLLETLQSALYAADDGCREARAYRDSVEFNPERLAQIDERLELLKTLKRKYGDTLVEVLRYRSEIGAQLDTLENAETRKAELDAAVESARRELESRAAALTKRRKAAVKPFSEAIQRELADLAMAATRFSVALEPREPGAVGAEAVEFLISPNPGEPLKPLAKIASGGEISRVMLALKSVLSRTLTVPTLVFDEVDTGIGGRTASVLAQKLDTLSRNAQILCITHLPQIAAHGTTHYQIEKREAEGRTRVGVAQLDGEARVAEIARMLGGGTSDTVLAHAREMLAHPG